MNILCSIHLYPPQHLCGAEMMIHHINKYLQSKGHTVKVLVHQANQHKIESHYVYDGIDVFPPDQYTTMSLFMQADVVMTHLDYSTWTVQMGSIFKKPVVHLVHNTYAYACIKDAGKPQYVVYNSEWTKNTLQYNHESMVLYPSCDYRHYDTNIKPVKNEYITLINLDENKGGFILKEIAKLMPDRKFIGVKGSYSEPIKIGQITDQPPNVEILEKQQDIREVYKRTRILIMPSKYESWGRTATEAMCSGIPVVCSTAAGLLENCGTAGIYVQNRDNAQEWVDAIKKLDNEKTFNAASKKAKERSRELDPQEGLARFEQWLREKVKFKSHF